MFLYQSGYLLLTLDNLKKYSLDLSKCDGKTCVRVIKKQCGYGKNADYCVIDPK